MSIEAIILPDTKNAELNEGVAEVLALDDLSTYRRIIAGRNFFRQYTPWQFEEIDDQTVVLGQALRLEPEISGVDPRFGSLEFTLTGDLPQGVSFDPTTGELDWEPEEMPAQLDEYGNPLVDSNGDPLPPPDSMNFRNITISASDISGERSSQSFNISLLASAAGPVINLDHLQAKQTKFTSLQSSSADGWAVAWLYDRTTDKLQKLQVGDRFEVGSYSGTVKAIGPEMKDMIFTFDGVVPEKLYRLVVGESLYDCKEVTGGAGDLGQ